MRFSFLCGEEHMAKYRRTPTSGPIDAFDLTRGAFTTLWVIVIAMAIAGGMGWLAFHSQVQSLFTTGP